ncbi:MAG: pantetheine-phosphate adenylyltransferase [bacterium]|nr:pantetheine-phosphate adenylyltransferase [bacterium]
MRTAVYPGSFDPITMGHMNIIERAAKVFDEVIIAVLVNSSKNPLFTIQERVEMVKQATSKIPHVKVETFSGLLVKYLEEKNINVIIKGLRAVTDFEYEYSMALMNKKLNHNIETFFMITEDKYAFLSSSKIKEIYRLGGRAPELLPDNIERILIEKIESAWK